MKTSLKITLFTAFATLTFSTLANAAFLPPTTADGNPFLVCKNAAMEVPEEKLSVEVVAASEERPFPFVTVKKISTNRAPDILFARGVSEDRSTNNAVTLYGNGLDMTVSSNSAGILVGQIVVEKEDGAVEKYDVNCEVRYYIANAGKTIKPAPPIER